MRLNSEGIELNVIKFVILLTFIFASIMTPLGMKNLFDSLKTAKLY